MDGVGEWATGSWGDGRGNQIHLQQEMRFPHSLSLLCSAYVNSAPWKMFGGPANESVKFFRLSNNPLIVWGGWPIRILAGEQIAGGVYGWHLRDLAVRHSTSEQLNG